MSKADYVLRQGQTRDHVCHWPGCNKQVPPAMWGCRAHWFRLPQSIRNAIWHAYRPGQEVDASPSREYVRAAREAQEWIAQHGGEQPESQLRALTICQPYAELIARGLKTIENRTWTTSYRGPLLIHAGKSRQWLRPDDIADYPYMAFGAIVAVADLVDIKPLRDLPLALQHDPHANGPFCWLLGRVYRLSEPVPCPGAQQLWAPDISVRRAVSTADRAAVRPAEVIS
jgi:hypothetical protein